MLPVFRVVHRWVGLVLALFLFVAGATGSIIAWEREVDHWLNPQIFRADSASSGLPPKSIHELADQIEREDPRLRLSFLPLGFSPGNTALMYVQPTDDPRTGQPHELDFDEIFVDPVTGKIQGRRLWGELSLRREAWVPLIYRLHYSLQLPGTWGIWFMGLLAIVWTIDCLVALVISFPHPRQWRRSFDFRFRQGGFKLLFDLHRSGGVWTWIPVSIIALTSIAMNLGEQLVEPLVKVVSSRRPTPFDSPSRHTVPVDPELEREAIVRLAVAEGRRLGIQDPPGALVYSREYGLYGVGLFDANEDHAGHGGFGWQPAWFYLDGKTGAVAGSDIPGTGSLGDAFLDLQFPLHSGRIIGTPGKAIVSILGVVVSMLCVTGVWLWARKRIRRARRQRGDAPSPAGQDLATREAW